MAVTASLIDVSDEALAREVMERAAGDTRAQEAELFARFAPRVRLYGLRHLRNEDSAAELVQQVLIRTIEKLRAGGVEKPERIGSFIFGVAKMTALEMSRMGKRQSALGPEAMDVEVSQVSLWPLARDRLAECMHKLSERARSVLVLTFFQEQSAREICDALAMSTGNVRIVRHRALEQLRECMGVE